jgi:signal transduction histidine kinase
MPKTPDQAKSYISNVTHQLKAPLTTIHLYAEALLSGSVGSLSANQKDYVQEMYSAAKKMIVTINELRQTAEKNISNKSD